MGGSIGGMRYRLMAAVAVAGISVASPAYAQDTTRQDYQIEAQPLSEALRKVGRQSGREVMFPADAVNGKVAPRLSGSYTPDEAIRALLAGSDLDADFKPDVVIIRGRVAPSAALNEQPAEASDILVTGSRIRGAPSASPVIVRTQEAMKDAGLNTLADVLRTIPQNFGGGQNPGIGPTVPDASGTNVGGGSTINLRGIGSSATLTLLNGHRLAYNLNTQGIDFSAVPFGAVERVEIVADGASALYGSDAVAGVVNIILRRDYDGFGTSARFGASTDGGNEQQQYSAVGGKVWDTGGIIAAYDFEHDTAIVARERSYAASTSPGAMLLPPKTHHSALISAHQSITHDLRVEVDGLYSHRRSTKRYALGLDGDYAADGFGSDYTSESFAVAPSVYFEPARGWSFSLAGMYGQDRSTYRTVSSFEGVEGTDTAGCYCNRALSIELDGEGSLLSLPGGMAKIAYGAGYRSNRLAARRWIGSAQNIRATQNSKFAFGELSLPVINEDTEVLLVHSLNLSAALRYEDYDEIGDVFSPKFGAIISPMRGLQIMASWGKSFKAPTLYQLHNSVGANLVSARSRGGTGYPANATVIALSGGNVGLKPERATTWTVTARVRPTGAEGASLEISYFHINYRDRITSPITYSSRALSDPIYQDLVDLLPNPAAQSEVLSSIDQFSNFLGRPYDPLQVVAIIHNAYLNVARQTIQGVDVSAGYRLDVAGGTLDVTANVAYLKSEQQLGENQPFLPLAGTLFNPPHIRARGSATWDNGALSLTSAVNYVGPVDDIRSTPSVQVRAFTSADFTARYKIGHAAWGLKETAVFLSIQNAFNEKPALIKTTDVYETPYDSTNVTPIGRFVTFGIETKW